METASLSTIKKELKTLPPEELMDYCLRLVKFKKENKELLSYLLFDAIDEQIFIRQIKEDIDIQFENLNKNSLYLAKKTIRKVLKAVNKYIKFSPHKTTEIELLIYFCKKLRRSGLPLSRSRVLKNMYYQRILQINKAMAKIHEDLQFDYRDEINALLK